ncbi:cell envelope integrity protein CreD [Acinetobacter sp. c1-l78]|uniref:cell envelope integrity protein CreD n=1 Tax=Acinetobacter sp. c1-l78 TaxID=3342803 RepID=UPI0035BB96E9
MQKVNVMAKLAILCVLLIAMMMALSFVRYLVNERQSYQNNVVEQIEQNQIGSQAMMSPFIMAPYKPYVACDNMKETTTSTPQTSSVINCSQDEYRITPMQQNDWNADFEVKNDQYQRGIYRATNFITHITGKGQFNTPASNPNNPSELTAAKMILPIKDLRGLSQKIMMTINGQKYAFSTSKAYPELGLELDLGNIPLQSVNQFEIDIQLEGLKQFNFFGDENTQSFNAQGNWQNVKYLGSSLPKTNNSDTQHFNAKWSNFASYTLLSNTDVNQCLKNAHCTLLDDNNNGLAMEFLDPKNIYQQTDRAIKYGWFITLITFACFFLFEVVKSLRIHPIQYLLVGVAQAVFFMLLLSVSEQLNYMLAYWIASVACISLISWYLIYVLKRWQDATIFALLLSSLYGVMYVLLQSSGMTLIFGSVLAFMMVAVAMFVTRNIDWYALNENVKPKNKSDDEETLTSPQYGESDE